jgi:zinc protease
VKRFLAPLLVALALAAPAHAADVRNIDLGRQAQVWFVEDHTVPIVSFTISLPGGSAHDPAGKAGLAAIAASMMDEGAGNLTSAAFHEALAAKAIQLSAQADRDYTVVSVTALSEQAGEAMRLLQLALTRPRFDNDILARMRAASIQTLQQEEVEPARVAAKAYMRAFFNGHPYGQPVNGDIAGLNAITANDLRAFARSHWVKNGIKIAVAGDISQAAVTKLLGSTFAPLPATAVPPVRDVGRLGAPGVHVVPMPVPQPVAMFGLPGIMRTDPDFIPGYVANYILGGGSFSSRLMDEVRTKRGLTYGISTSLQPYLKASLFIGQVGTRADAVNQTIQVVRQTMAELVKNGPTQQELDDAKTYLTGSFPMAFASNTGMTAQLGTFQRQNLDIGYVVRRNSLIQAVTLDQVRRAGRRLFDPSRLTVVVAGSPGSGPQRARPPVAPATPPTTAQTSSIQTGTQAPPAPAPKAPVPGQAAPKPVDKPATPQSPGPQR